ncbi:hypothetical protein NUW54_g6122 [Trametes sanguinea]|uniref:Uncharacterized protein n=1 Tax=Trametes sanguinea TaxID=158606 RepID=A0ACC1PUT5_9APHY|nr:hypothetical protein NUW54_g6122 [Trametes sanguinea]
MRHDFTNSTPLIPLPSTSRPPLCKHSKAGAKAEPGLGRAEALLDGPVHCPYGPELSQAEPKPRHMGRAEPCPSLYKSRRMWSSSGSKSGAALNSIGMQTAMQANACWFDSFAGGSVLRSFWQANLTIQ